MATSGQLRAWMSKNLDAPPDGRAYLVLDYGDPEGWTRTGTFSSLGDALRDLFDEMSSVGEIDQLDELGCETWLQRVAAFGCLFAGALEGHRESLPGRGSLLAASAQR